MARTERKLNLKTLCIAKHLDLPLETVTQSLAILAKRRAGKSYTARRIAEQLIRAKLQTVIIDPKGDWWGIRSAADGKSPGLPVVILGGEHGDLPLEVGSGEVIAKLIVEERVHLVLDLSSFRKNEVAKFMGGEFGPPKQGFLEAIYRMKAREEFRSPVMLVVDEADAIAPQKPFKGEERMLGAIEDIVRRGGQRGVGCLLITQRSAVLNKNVLTQVQLLVAMRTIAPQDLQAMNEWIDVHGTAEQRKILMASLPSLPVGDAWFWSPGWPTDEGIFEHVHVLPIETFDSGATPKPGERRVEPRNAADVDLNALRRQMAETIERAKADDPRELRKQIADLKKELSAKPQAASAASKEITAERLTKEFDNSVHAERRRIRAELGPRINRLRRSFKDLVPVSINIVGPGASFKLDLGEEALAEINHLEAALDKAAPLPEPERALAAAAGLSTAPMARAIRSMPRVDSPSTGDTGRITDLEQRILNVLAQYPDGRSRKQVAHLAGSRLHGGFDQSLANLRKAGLIVGPGSCMVITEAGQALAVDEPLPTGTALLDHWIAKLPGIQAKILELLYAVYPGSLSRAEIAERVGSKLHGGFDQALADLRKIQLIAGSGKANRIAETFLEQQR